MVNQIVLDYLMKNESRYKLDNLKTEILAKGYTEDDYYEALKIIHSKKFKSGEVSKLPSSNVVKEKGKKGVGVGAFILILFLVFLFGFGLIILFNYLGYPVFGFNFFDLF